MPETKAIYDIILYVSYILIGLAAIGTLAFAVRQIVTNFSNLKMSILGAAILLVVLLIAFALSSGEAMDPAGSTTTKLVGGGLLATFILVIIAVVSAVFTEVSKYFK